jgi:hypothetical protein
MQVFYDRFPAKSGWNCSSILNLLGSGQQKPAVPNVQWKTPDDGQRGFPKRLEFYVCCFFFVFLALQPIVVVFSQPGSGL